jgi:hypothetical protein
MTSVKRKYRWLIIGLGALFVTLLILALLLPWVVNLESVKGKILTATSQAIGGQVNYARIDLSLFPHPGVVIHQGSLSIPGELSGHSDYFAVYPEVLPLFTGKLRFSRVDVKGPVFTYEIREERPIETKEKPKPLTPADILKALDPFMGSLASNSPNLDIHVENGRITLAMEQELVFQYQDLRAQTDVPENKMSVDITDFTFAVPAPGEQQSKKDKATPNQVAPEGNKKLVIKGKSLRTALDVGEDKATLFLNELNLDHPQLNISGKLIVQQASPEISLELAAGELDIHSTRQVALALAGSDPTVRDIFDIMRGGTIPLITFSSQGSMLAELDDTENMVFEADLVDGKVSISSVDLHMEGVKGGDIHISKGILYGKNLDARLGNTQARDGTLKVGLEGEDAPFHLDIMVDADLAQLPLILNRVVNDKAFVRELKLLDHFEGKASGKLVLGETLDSIDAIVDVSQFEISATYQRTPFPLEITGGGFYYDDTRIALDNVSVKMGRSLFSEITAKLDLSKELYLESDFGKLEISLDEIFPWLLSMELYSGMRNDFRSVKGTLVLSARFAGSLLQPKTWKYQSRGQVRDFDLDTPLLPWPVRVNGGSFDATEKITEQRFSFQQFRVSAMDGSLNVSGVIKDYTKKGVNNADMTLQGSLGPQATQWVSELIQLPPEIRIRPPVSISTARLAWEKDAKTSFVGNLVINNGPKVSIDFLQTPQELTFKNLHIQDETSNSRSSFSLKEKEINLSFAGKLTEKTLRRIHQGYDLLQGRVDGNFRARILLDQPKKSTAQGRLAAQDLIVPWGLETPLKIESISLTGLEDSLKIDSVVCSWADTDFTVKGNLSSSETDLLFDMEISADHLDLEKIEEGLGEDSKEENGEKPVDIWDLPLQGTVRLKTEDLTYEGYTWSPVHADIYLKSDSLDIAVTEADLCGISTPGNLVITAQSLRLDFEPVSKNQEVDLTLDCLWDATGTATGSFDLVSKVMAEGQNEDIVKSSQGNIEFLAKDGRIYTNEEFGVLGKVFTRLSVADMFQGKLPDMKKEGFPYKSLTIKAKLEGGKLRVEEGHLNGEGMQVFCHGDVDLVEEKLNLEVAVAPLKTIDTVVKYTPVFGKILGGTLVSVPVKVTGDWSDPKVDAMAASSVGKGLLGIMERTVKYPVDLVQPLVSEKKEN